MAWRIVKQPNGLLSIFSDVVDDFTYFDLTVEQAEEICREDHDMGKQAAKEKVQAGVLDYEPWKHKVPGDGQCRWRDCLETIEMRHGEKQVQRRVQQCTEPPSEEKWDKWKNDKGEVV